MLVIRKEDNSNSLQQSKDQEHAYNLMLYILKNFSDIPVEDQLVIFNKMSFIRTTKSSFIALREKVLADYNQNVNQESITVTDLKADYHINNGMLEMHLNSIDQINELINYYEELFEREKQKVHPNIDELTKLSLVYERLINRRSILNTGTPIILFFRFQSKKQKLEVQQVKEKYQQQVLVLKKEFEEKKLALENKEKEFIANNDSSRKTDIAEDDNVTNPNIDELEHHAKLKDSGNRTIRSNINRSNSKPNPENERVQSDTSNSNSAGTTNEDRSSEIFGESTERRSKEAVF